MLTVKEAAERLRCSEQNIYDLKDAGLLPYVTVGAKGKGFRFLVSDIDEFISQRRAVNGKQAMKPRVKLKHLKLY